MALRGDGGSWGEAAEEPWAPGYVFLPALMPLSPLPPVSRVSHPPVRHSCLILQMRKLGFLKGKPVLLETRITLTSDGPSGGFPGGTSGKEPACQCERCKRRRFDPWVRKSPWSRAWQPAPACLPGESQDRGAWGLQSMGSNRAGHN